MAQLKVPEQPNVRTIAYDNLMGVDYQSDATEVSRRHSPEMVNMISDLGGMPVKRCGYRRVGGAYKGFAVVNGDDWAVKVDAFKLHAVKIAVGDDGTISEESDTQLSTRTNFGGVFYVFGYQQYIYILCPFEWLEFDTDTKVTRTLGISEGTLFSYVDAVRIALNRPDVKFIPTVQTMYKPNGQELVALPDGTDITGATEGVNMLTPFRRVEYCVTTDTADETVFVIPNQAKIASNVLVEVLDPTTYDWVATASYDLTGATTLACRRPDDARNATSTVVDAKVALNTAPYIKVMVDNEPHLRFRNSQSVEVPAGVPNVRITYAPFSMSVYASGQTTVYNGFYRKERNDLMSSSARAFYDARLFVGIGVRTYYSQVNAPLKLDDNYYFDVDNNVVTYAKASTSLAVIAEDTGKSNIYLAVGNYDTSLAMPTYSIKASNAAVGAITSSVSGSLNDEPIFLSKLGLYGLTTNYLSEKYSIMRSGKINRRLCKDPALDTAVGTNFNGYFYLAVGTHMYVLDGRHKDASRNGDNSYECYYFDNLPRIRRIDVLSNRMFFTDGTYTYTWNDDLEEQYRYLDDAVMDSETYVWTGTPVKCKWCSTIDGDNAPQYYKTLQKKGTMVTLAPPMQTSCQITLIRDAHDIVYVGRFNGSTFSLSDAVLDAFTKKKVKKYKRLQFVVENNEPEPFGIISIVKSFVLNNYAKR